MTQECKVHVVNRWWRGLWALALLGCTLGGCTALPDTRGFTVATIQLKEAMGTTGEVVKAEVASASSAGAVPRDDDSIKKLDAAWSATMRSLDAMVAYAKSIEEIVDAGNRGAESARDVADSVKRLLDTVSIDVATSASAEVVGVATDTIAFVYGEYAKHVAAQSLEEALANFGPSMVRISALINAQVTDARRLFVLQIEFQVHHLNKPELYGEWIALNDELSKLQDSATLQLFALISEGPARQPAKINELKAQLAQLDIVHQNFAPHIAEYNEKLKAIRQREKAGLSIIGAAENALAIWGATQLQLAKAVKERKPVNLDSLIAAVAEVRTLTQRWREL
ncbi:hypothetical protein [Achromobacter sp.]|uniref:hypothetical protein n=1 Tax=Achromobacter sp. TaxID=134375 RepID=UPI0028A7E3F7|nr:hypothetical protein [Achromobacter sp.]